MMLTQKVPPVFETNVDMDITIVADQEAFFADAATPTHPPHRWIQANAELDLTAAGIDSLATIGLLVEFEDTIDVPHFDGPFGYLSWLAKCQAPRVVAGAFFGSFWMVGLAVPPYVISKAIDHGLGPRDWTAVWTWTLALLFVGVLNAWSGISRHRTMTRIRLDASFRTSRALIAKVNAFGAELDRRVASGEMAVLGLGDVFTTSRALTVTGPGVGAVVAYVFVGMLLARVSGLLALIVMLGVPTLVVCIGPLLSRVIGRQEAYRGQQGQVFGLLLDIIGGLRVLNAFGAKETYAARFNAESDALRVQGVRVGGATSWISGLAVGLPALFLAGVTWLAARMALSGTISIGELVAVYGYVAMLVVPVSFFIEGADQITRAVGSARQIIGFLNMEVASESGDRDGVAPRGPARLCDPHSGVEIAPASFTVLVSSDPGSLLPVIDRLGGMDPDSGALWGGQRLDTLPTDEVRRRILVADNDAHLFAGTLRSVVLAGATAADAAVLRAITVASADDVVQALRDGLDSSVGEAGKNLSEGQRQRIRLARAVLAGPEVLIAFEPTSSLDAPTEAIVAERLRSAREGSTTVVVSSSPLLLAHADAVQFIQEGHVVSTGTHRQLYERSDAYRRVVTRENEGPTSTDELAVAGGESGERGHSG